MEQDGIAEAAALLSALNEQGVKLWSENGALHWRAPRGAISPGQLELCKRLKTQLVASLSTQNRSINRDAIKEATQRSYSAPLSYQQEWAFNSWMASGEHAVTRVAFRLHGPLNVEALRTAVDRVIERNESLRTRVVSVEHIWTQQVDIYKGGALKLISAIDEGDAEALVSAFSDLSIDMTAGPTFRAVLVTLHDRDHTLVIALHHLFIDGVAWNILINELWVLYRAIVEDRQPSLSKVRLQYPDYALFQRSPHIQHRIARAKTYWEKALDGAVPVKLPTDFGLESIREFNHAQVPVTFGSELTAGLERLARGEKTTLATVLLASFVGTLSQWSSQRDFVIPFVVSGRGDSEEMEVLGYLTHFIPLRFRLTGNERFVDLLNLVTTEYIEACSNLDFGLAISERPTLFEGVALQWMPWGYSKVGSSASCEWGSPETGLAVEMYPLPWMPQPPEARLMRDVDWELCKTESGVGGFCWYRSDRFTQETISHLMQNLRLGLERAVTDPCSQVLYRAAE